MTFRREWLVLLLTVVVLASVAAIGLRLYARPSTLRIAVGPAKSVDARLVAAIGTRLAANGAPFRLRTVAAESPAAAGALLAKRAVDLAVVRQDDPLPSNAQAIAIFHHNSIILMSLAASGVRELTDLRGRTVGVIGHNGVNRSLLGEILPFYGLPASAVSVETVSPSRALAALREGAIAAILMAGPITSRLPSDAIARLARDGAPDVVFIPLENGEAIAKRDPAFKAIEIDAGSFGGSPARPLKPVATLQFSHFLVADRAMSNSRAADIARTLFSMRPSLAIDFPSANQIEGPDTAKDALVPVHPGAAAFFDGEEENFFDEYSDIFYFALAGLGLIGSALAGLQRFALPAGGVKDRELFRRLRILVDQVRAASTEAELGAREVELNELFVIVLSKAEQYTLEDAQLGALSVAIEYLRRTIETRRAALMRQPESLRA
jgi:TRAP transporter TAXI family solute receptor